MKLDVPYYSQYIDVTDPFWMLRACGVTCLKMIGEFHGKEVPDIVTLCNEARDRNGYHMANGWVHDYLVTEAQELGLQAFRKEGMTTIEEIAASLEAGNPVMVSVEKRILEQTRFHIIVIVGHEGNTFFYHEPESTDKEKGKFRSCTQEEFKSYWRGKAIFITK
jgi:uncharacterized protein YvpB